MTRPPWGALRWVWSLGRGFGLERRVRPTCIGRQHPTSLWITGIYTQVRYCFNRDITHLPLFTLIHTFSMTPTIPVSAWAKMHGITRQSALNMIRWGKVPGAERRKVTTEWWYVPVDALPDFTDRRRKDARKRRIPNSRSA